MTFYVPRCLRYVLLQFQQFLDEVYATVAHLPPVSVLVCAECVRLNEGVIKGQSSSAAEYYSEAFGICVLNYYASNALGRFRKILENFIAYIFRIIFKSIIRKIRAFPRQSMK